MTSRPRQCLPDSRGVAARIRQVTAHRTVLTVASLVLTWVAVAAAGDDVLRRTVNLDAPGAMEHVRATNLAHFDKILKIVDGIVQQTESAVPRWLRVNFDARDVAYRPVVMTSHPPKRRLAFALDDTRYEVIVVLTNTTGAIIPAK